MHRPLEEVRCYYQFTIMRKKSPAVTCAEEATWEVTMLTGTQVKMEGS